MERGLEGLIGIMTYNIVLYVIKFYLYFLLYFYTSNSMEKSLVIILLLLNCQFVTMAQNWNLFPKGQYALFELTFSSHPSVIERVSKDSSRLVNDSLIGYFNAKIINESECTIKYDLKKIYDRVPNYLHLDSTGEKNNWQYFNYSFSHDAYRFKFNPLAKVKESWIINDRITFTCDSASQVMLFGQLDSVKYFSNSINPVPFVLSKTFGLIEFVPFGQLLDASESDVGRVKLIGYEKEGIQKGFTVPDFSDFFHLNAGDVVIWHYDRTAWPPPASNGYYKDSITHSIITADSVIYEITRIQGNSITKDKHRFYRNQFSRFLNNQSAPGIITKVNPMGLKTPYLFFYCGCPRMGRQDTIFSMFLQWGSLLMDPNYCNLGRVYDGGAYFSFDTRVGLSVENSVKAVGSIINGEKWGITTIPTGISQVKNASFKVYPNPCSDKIMVQSKGTGRLDYKLFNSNGQLVKAGQLNNQCIEIAALPDGLYHLQLSNERMQETQKIVKAGSRK